MTPDDVLALVTLALVVALASIVVTCVCWSIAHVARTVRARCAHVTLADLVDIRARWVRACRHPAGHEFLPVRHVDARAMCLHCDEVLR